MNYDWGTLKISLKEYGQINDILAAYNGSIIDGCHRLKCLEELRKETGDPVYTPRIRRLEWCTTRKQCIAITYLANDVFTIFRAKKFLNKNIWKEVKEKFGYNNLLDDILSVSRSQSRRTVYERDISKAIQALFLAVQRVEYRACERDIKTLEKIVAFLQRTV